MKVLLIEDDQALGALIKQRLTVIQACVDWVSDVGAAESALRSFAYDLVILDRGLPDGDGLSLLDVALDREARPPVLIVSALSDVKARVEALDRGADDVLAKPFDPDELIARCRALVRRSGLSVEAELAAGNLTFSAQWRTARVSGRILSLPRRELQILEALLRRKERVVTRDHLTDAIYSFEEELESNALEANISRLRKRLRDAGAVVEIQVVRGVGYFLSAQAPA